MEPVNPWENRDMHGPWSHEYGPSNSVLRQLGPALCECAAHMEAGSMERAARYLDWATGLGAAAGDGPVQRLAVPMRDCLARLLIRPMVPAVADALIDPSEYVDRRCVRAARRSLFDLSPFPKVAMAVSNRAILEAMENEKNVHVIDFAGPAAQPWQWIQLLRDFHGRPEGPPHLRLTVVHDDEGVLAKASESLSDEAEDLDMPFQFHGVVGQIETLDLDDLHGALQLKSGEARAVVCTLQLHRLLAVADGAASSFSAGHRFNRMASAARIQQMASRSCPPSVGSGVACGDDDGDGYNSPATPLLGFVSPPLTTPPFQMPPAMARFLSAARAAVSPKILVLTEQEASHSGVSFRKRFAEALGYYAAMYDSLDAVAAACRGQPATAERRAEVERAVLGEEIRDVLLREGARRRERHDRLQQWAARMEVAGFGSVPLSYVAIRQGNDVARRCGLGRRCENREHGGCLLMCWRSWPLYSVSAWRPDRGSAYGSSSEYRSAASHMVTPAHSFDELTMC